MPQSASAVQVTAAPAHSPVVVLHVSIMAASQSLFAVHFFSQ